MMKSLSFARKTLASALAFSLLASTQLCAAATFQQAAPRMNVTTLPGLTLPSASISLPASAAASLAAPAAGIEAVETVSAIPAAAPVAPSAAALISAPAAKGALRAALGQTVSKNVSGAQLFDNASYKGETASVSAAAPKTPWHRSLLSRATALKTAAKTAALTLAVAAPAMAQSSDPSASGDPASVIWTVAKYALIGLPLLIVGIKALRSFRLVQQGEVVVTKQLGKFKRTLPPGGPYLLTPFIEGIYRRINTQNRTFPMTVTANSKEGATVTMEMTVTYNVFDTSSPNIEKAAFAFADEQSFESSFKGAIDGSVRAAVMNKAVAEIPKMRVELANQVKTDLKDHVGDWGYRIVDIQINKTEFSKEVQESWDNVAASVNRIAAAQNDAQTLLTNQTAEANARAAKIKIESEANKYATLQQAQALSGFRDEIASGMEKAAEKLKAAGLDPNLIPYTMWLETLEKLVEKGKGNTFFFDGTTEGGVSRQLRQIQSVVGSAAKQETPAPQPKDDSTKKLHSFVGPGLIMAALAVGKMTGVFGIVGFAIGGAILGGVIGAAIGGKKTSGGGDFAFLGEMLAGLVYGGIGAAIGAIAGAGIGAFVL